MDWNISKRTLEKIREAGEAFDSQAGSLKLAVSSSTDIDRATLSRLRVGADGALQMAIQLAHAKLFPDDPLAPSTYESAATPHFKRGRTETAHTGN